MKKTRGDIIFLHMCTKGDNQMIFGSQDMECNRQAIFLPFYPGILELFYFVAIKFHENHKIRYLPN